MDYQLEPGTPVRVQRVNMETVEGVILRAMPWVITGEWYEVGRKGRKRVEVVETVKKKKVRRAKLVADVIGMYTPDMMEVLT